MIRAARAGAAATLQTVQALESATSWWSYITPEGFTYILAGVSTLVIGGSGVLVARWRKRLRLDPETQDAVRRPGDEPPASLNAALSVLGSRLGDVENELTTLKGRFADAVTHIDRLEAWGEAGWARVRGHRQPKPLRPASLRGPDVPADPPPTTERTPS